MSDVTPREEGSDYPPAATRSPVVVSQGLTYRDLQRTVILGFGIYLLFQFAQPITTLLLLFLLVFILSAVLNPMVAWLEARRVPRIAGTLGIILLAVGLFVLVGWLAVPPLLDEIGNAIQKLRQPGVLTQSYEEVMRRAPWLRDQVPSPQDLVQNISGSMGVVFRQVGRYTLNVFAGLFSLLLLLVLVIYTTAHPEPLLTGLLGAVPERHRAQTETALRRILVQLKNWGFGSMVLGLIVGVMTGVGLWGIGQLTGHPFPYVLLFSVIAGVGELIPNIGPIVSAAPPILMALTIDPMLAVWVALLFLVIQQAENNLIVPFVMGQSLNLHPVSLIFTVLVMGVLFGLLGAILAVPVCAIAKVLWEEFYLLPRKTNTAALQEVAAELVRHPQADQRDQNVLERDDKSLASAVKEDTGPRPTERGRSG